MVYEKRRVYYVIYMERRVIMHDIWNEVYPLFDIYERRCTVQKRYMDVIYMERRVIT